MSIGTAFKAEPQDGTWFPFFTSSVDPATGETKYDDPLPGAAEFRIRSLKPFHEERLSQRKRERDMVFNPKSRSMEKVTSFKEQTIEEIRKDRDDAIDYAITGIRNAFWDEAGKQPINNSREDKLKLRSISVFDRFLASVWQIIEEQEVAEVKAQEKNSSTSQSGGRASAA